MHPNKISPRVQSNQGAHFLPGHGLVPIFTKTMARKYFTEYTKLTHALTSCRHDQHEVCALNDELWQRKTALGLGGETDRQTYRWMDQWTAKQRGRRERDRQTGQGQAGPCIRINEPWHEISNNVACATNKASDQPAHMRSLIIAFAWICYEC